MAQEDKEPLIEEPVSKELVEAAIEYCGGNKGADARVRAGFVMGAKWADKVMMEKAVEAVISQTPCTNEIILRNPASVHWFYLPQEMNKLGIKKGDKVKVIIIKEE